MVTQLVDTHCHLNHTLFAGEVDETLERARAAGVGECILIGFDLPSSRLAAEMADPAAGLFATVGIHPHDALTWSAEAERELRQLAERPGVVAIGEIGLDFYRDLSPQEAQYAAFRAQLELAMDLGLPFVTHTRESVAEALDVLEPYCRAGARGVMHCWSGAVDEARRAWSLGLYLGIGGVVTYKKPGDLPLVVQAATESALLLETDAPYLPPMPHRGKRNEPGYVALIAQKVAELRGVSPNEVAASTTANARRLFNLSMGSL